MAKTYFRATPTLSFGRRIIVSYLILLVIAFIIADISFTTLTRQYLIKETKAGLLEQGNIIVSMNKKATLNPLAELRVNRILLNTLEANTVVVDTNGIIINSNRPRRYLVGEKFVYPDLPKVLAGETTDKLWSNGSEDMVGVGIPLSEKDGSIAGGVILFSALENIDSMSRQINRQILKGLFISSVIALFIGVFMSRSIVNPANKLKSAALALADRKYDVELPVEGTDELGEVARSFRIMRDQIRAYDETQRSFLQTASHELKTPLMSIQGYAEGIKDGVFEGADADKSLDIIISESRRLKGIVDEMILLSKLESLDGIYQFQPVTAGQIAYEAAEKMRGFALELQKEIRFIDERKIHSSPTFSGDRDKLIQAVINLLSNALRHARSHVEIVAGDDLIRVRDDGDGIAPEEIPKLFQRFYKGTRGDTGLGLSIALAIVEKHGGRIDLSNRPSVGAEFTLTFGPQA
ncbi:HAMP domain-containing histidine kinase [Heliobacterium chlorum]|uniref:histidine kinase n=1 Tax=Heliobacterium chlorum TaxID=2698 RepID=A0ABR7T1I2_HELCL|nr:HAMP domain-containing sensor histidine kinase [Heliobacterium chlorum]MBC9784638.1 HAMP domain-containing histidine kinase [Heliobacterium chlorum]